MATAPSLKSLGIDRLSVDERIQLLDAIWCSLAEDLESMPLPDWHREELERRLAAHEASPHAGSSWEEVKERLRARRGGRSA